MPDPVAVGFRCHSGWAVMVIVRGSSLAPVVLDRRRIDLTSAGLPTQPYHAVAEGGAARSIIAQVEGSAAEAVRSAVSSVSGVVAVGVVAADRALPTDLDAILRVHARLHAAEGALYENAVIEAGTAAGLAVHVVAPDAIAVSRVVEDLRATVGPPWQKDHKWAATAALAALDSVR